MRYLSFWLLVIFLMPISINSYAETNLQNQTFDIVSELPKQSNQLDCQVTNLAQKGCCSYHKGVCGCSVEGRTECCDGTVSSSCLCDPTIENNKKL